VLWDTSLGRRAWLATKDGHTWNRGRSRIHGSLVFALLGGRGWYKSSASNRGRGYDRWLGRSGHDNKRYCGSAVQSHQGWRQHGVEVKRERAAVGENVQQHS